MALPPLQDLLDLFPDNTQGLITPNDMRQQTTVLYDAIADNTTNLATKLSLSGGTMTGTLILDQDPSAPLQAATKAYVDNIAIGTGFVLRTGDTMTGDLLIPTVPSQASSAASKAYVDSEISNSLGSLSVILTDGSVNMDMGYVPVSDQAVATKNYVDTTAGASGAVLLTPTGEQNITGGQKLTNDGNIESAAQLIGGTGRIRPTTTTTVAFAVDNTNNPFSAPKGVQSLVPLTGTAFEGFALGGTGKTFEVKGNGNTAILGTAGIGTTTAPSQAQLFVNNTNNGIGILTRPVGDKLANSINADIRVDYESNNTSGASADAGFAYAVTRSTNGSNNSTPFSVKGNGDINSDGVPSGAWAGITVSSTGNKLTGTTGWTSQKTATGTYRITHPNGAYSIVTTSNSTSADVSVGVNLVNGTTTDVFTHNQAGALADTPFNLVAIKVG